MLATEARTELTATRLALVLVVEEEVEAEVGVATGTERRLRPRQRHRPTDRILRQHNRRRNLEVEAFLVIA